MRRLSMLLVALVVVSMFIGGVAAQTADTDDARADLEIDQPEYVDTDVTVERTDNATVYHVRGPDHTITFDSAPFDNVTAVGVLDGPGSIAPHDATETFTFDAAGSEATSRVFFDVEREGSSTRYVADIRASDVEWAHLPSGEYDEMQSELSTWEQLKRDAQNAVPGQDVVETIQSGLTKEAFFSDPTSELQENMQGTLIMMFMTPGGLLITASFFGTVLLLLARSYRYKNRTQKQFAELEEMEREKDEAWLQKARKILQQCDLNEFFPDHIARAMRDYFGSNTWLAFKQYTLLRSPTSVKATLLQMMAQVGYVGRLEYDAEGQLIDARAVKAPEETSIPVTDGGDGHEIVEHDLSTLEYDTDEDREIIERIPPEDLDESVFDEDIDPSDVSFPIDNREVTDAELLEELEPSFPGDFEDRQELAEVLGKLMEFVANHDHTDDEGDVRREMDLLSFMMEMDTILNDEADFPTAYDYQKELLYIADRMDKGDRLDQRVDTLSLDGLSSGSSIDIAGGD